MRPFGFPGAWQDAWVEDLFDELVEPSVREGWERLSPQNLGRFAPAAQRNLRRSLASRLQESGREAFAWSCRIFLQTPGIINRLRTADPRSALRELYFPEGSEPELQRFLRSFPALDDLWKTQTDLWVAFASDLLAHAVDFLGESDSIADLEMDLSDLHRGNRAVAKVVLPAGTSWFYKSRTGVLERGWNELLDWMNGMGFSEPFRTVRVVVGEDHCWMEAVGAFPCHAPSEVAAFYHRCGALLCLYYQLGGIDLHAGNLVAAGSQPMLVDCETLFHPAVEDAGIPPAVEASVLRCGMLPVRHPGGEPRRLASALGNRERGPHAVYLGEQRQHAADHTVSLCAGYCEMHALLRKQAPEFHARREALSHFPWRRLRRATEDYSAALQRSLAPECLRNPLSRRERLAEASASKPFCPREITALLQCDVPFFRQEDDLNCGPADLELEMALRQIAEAFQ